MAYATREDMELQFGRVNITAWADIDNKGDEDFITARIARALEEAETRLNVMMGLRGYEIPITADPVPKIIRDITAKMASIILFDSHGVRDFDASSGKSTNAMSAAKKELHDWIRGFRSGLILIPDLEFLTTSAPGVVRDDD